MIGLQATELYLQTEEAYFSAVLFYFFSSIVILRYFSSNLDFCVFSKCFCSTPLEVMKLRCINHLWIAVVYTVQQNLTYVYLIHTYRHPQLKQDCSPSTHLPKNLCAKVCLGRGIFSYLQKFLGYTELHWV